MNKPTLKEQNNTDLKLLPREFYNRDTVAVAQELLGKYIVRTLSGGEKLICRIAETEAYIGRCDKACHAYNYRRTKRTETLFAPPAHAYIYLIYGMYHCLNFVTEAEGEPCAVLIRAAVPTQNIDIMTDLRYGLSKSECISSQLKNLMNGPGKLCRALSLTRSENGLDLTHSALTVCESGAPADFPIHCGKRIGIDYAEEAVDFPWRFWADFS